MREFTADCGLVFWFEAFPGVGSKQALEVYDAADGSNGATIIREGR
jgi:hypothetical protein